MQHLLQAVEIVDNLKDSWKLFKSIPVQHLSDQNFFEHLGRSFKLHWLSSPQYCMSKEALRSLNNVFLRKLRTAFASIDMNCMHWPGEVSEELANADTLTIFSRLLPMSLGWLIGKEKLRLTNQESEGFACGLLTAGSLGDKVYLSLYCSPSHSA